MERIGKSSVKQEQVGGAEVVRMCAIGCGGRRDVNVLQDDRLEDDWVPREDP